MSVEPVADDDGQEKNVDDTNRSAPAINSPSTPILTAIFHLKAERRKLQAKLESNQCQIKFLENKLAPTERGSADDAVAVATTSVAGSTSMLGMNDGGDLAAKTLPETSSELMNNIDDSHLNLAEQLKCALNELKAEIQNFRHDVKQSSTASVCGSIVMDGDVRRFGADSVSGDAQVQVDGESDGRRSPMDGGEHAVDAASASENDNICPVPTLTMSPIDSFRCNDDCNNTPILIKNVDSIKQAIHATYNDNCLLKIANEKLETQLNEALEMYEKEKSISVNLTSDCESAYEKIIHLERELERMGGERDSLHEHVDRLLSEKQQLADDMTKMSNDFNETIKTQLTEIEQLQFELEEWNAKHLDDREKRKRSVDDIQIRVDYLNNYLEHTLECAGGLKHTISNL